MKKILLSFAFALCALTSVNAQVLKFAPINSDSYTEDDYSVTQQNISAAANQAWWGYYNGTNDRTSVGVGGKEIYDQAIFIPGDKGPMKDKVIKAVRFYLRSKNVLKNVKVWISTSLPATADDADILVMDIEKSKLQAGAEADNLAGKANDVELTTPYTMTENGVYVGYSFEITSVTTSNGQYPVVASNQFPQDNGFFIKTSQSQTEWLNATELGNLALMVLAEGEFPQNSAQPVGLTNVLVGIGDPATTTLTLSNTGKGSISSIDYILSIDGNQQAETHVNLSKAISDYCNNGNITISLGTFDEVGAKDLTITITKVNGVANEDSNNTISAILNVVEELFQRMVLVEEFTGESCVYCPGAASSLAAVLHNPKYADKVAAICHHSGFYSDPYTTSFDNAYAAYFYNDNGGTYAPAMMYDRYTGSNKSSSGKPTPVYGVGGVEDITQMVDLRLTVPTSVKLYIDPIWNDDMSKIEVTVKCMRMEGFDNPKLRLNLTLTEDSIMTTNQTGASGTFWHMHVGRAVNSTWGEPVTWNGNEFIYTYTFDVNSNWQSKYLKVVGYLFNYDSSNPGNCEIDNSAIARPHQSDDTGISTLSNSTVEGTIRHNIGGQRLNAPAKGINLVRMSDGTVRKVLVK